MNVCSRCRTKGKFMPPKPKFTKEELTQAAFEITRRNGIDSIVARNLGKTLKIAASTIFTHFNSMEEHKETIIFKARTLYNQYVEEGLKMTPPLKGFGVQYIKFAMEEPNLFSVLFMQRQKNYDYVDFIVDEGHYEKVLSSVENTFGINRQQSESLYHNLWAYAHGLAVMSATGVCSFSIEVIAGMLGMACRSFLFGLKLPYDERENIIPSVEGVIYGDLATYVGV